VSHQLRKTGLKEQVKLTYVTSEPFLGHFGIGGLPHGEALLGRFLRKEKIDAVTSATVDHVDEGKLALGNGAGIPFAYAMVIPPFVGQDVVRTAPEICDPTGYIPVRDTYQTHVYDDMYAVGVAAQVVVPWTTPVPVGVPKTGLPTERMAHTAATNIASQIRGEEPTAHREFKDIPAVCIMDAGNNGVLILADKMLPPRKHGVMVPGPQSHAMKVAFEKYFLWKTRHGYVSLP
jgi:sulfide:quinone oxidoreductase